MKKTNINLIPETKNPSPDYYCTWQTQLYATSDGKPKAQREILGEHAFFALEKPFGWAYFYEQARRDLIFVMDDSWDIPLSGDTSFYGSLILNEEKFPSAVSLAKNNAKALQNLSERISSLGWKGLGGWVHAGESKAFQKNFSAEDYWKIRLEDAKKSGFSYWKVDWGNHASDICFRKMLTSLGKAVAPALIIEHAVTQEALAFADVYRTYDVPALMSIPMTMEKLAAFADIPHERMVSLINCEDEVYMAAAGGFTMGVMRHPYSGVFPNGKPDVSFPSFHRNLKTKLYEVLRAVRWHRIAPAFCGGMTVSPHILRDSWHFLHPNEEIEAWWFDMPAVKDDMENQILTKSAPSAIARNCELPKIFADEQGRIPYALVSKNPCGVFSVATLGRTAERTYWIPRCDVSLTIENADQIGVFGEYRNLILKTDRNRKPIVFMQDLASDFAYDVTDEISFVRGELVVPGNLISKLGTSAQPADDTSEPGLLITLQ